MLESFAHLKIYIFIIYFLLTIFTFIKRREILCKSSFLGDSFLSFQSRGLLFHFLVQFFWLEPIAQCGLEEMRADTLALLMISRGKLSIFHQ